MTREMVMIDAFPNPTMPHVVVAVVVVKANTILCCKFFGHWHILNRYKVMKEFHITFVSPSYYPDVVVPTVSSYFSNLRTVQMCVPLTLIATLKGISESLFHHCCSVSRSVQIEKENTSNS